MFSNPATRIGKEAKKFRTEAQSSKYRCTLHWSC